MKVQDCALIILASGLSKRFGASDKLMAELNGKPILQHVIDNVVSLPFAARFAIIPETSKARHALLRDAGFKLIENPDPKAGQGYSLRLSAETVLQKKYKSMCVMLGDMPFVPASHILNMMIGMKDKDRAISVCNNIALPPTIFGFEALQSLAKIKPLIESKTLFSGKGVYKHPLSKHAARDIDTAETLESLQVMA